MFEIKLPEFKCPECGKKMDYAGLCFLCSSKSDYDKGFDAGKKKAEKERDPFYYSRCHECHQIVGHSSWCSKTLKDFRSDYEKGFDAGYNKPTNTFGFLNGDNIYSF